MKQKIYHQWISMKFPLFGYTAVLVHSPSLGCQHTPGILSFSFSDFKMYITNRKTVIPARQTGIQINTRNAWCIIFKWENFNIKQHRIFKPLRFISTVISLHLDSWSRGNSFSARFSARCELQSESLLAILGDKTISSPLRVINCGYQRQQQQKPTCWG